MKSKYSVSNTTKLILLNYLEQDILWLRKNKFTRKQILDLVNQSLKKRLPRKDKS